MCSTPKPRPKPLPTRRYQGMSIDAIQRFTATANAADEKRQKRQENVASQQVIVRNSTPESSRIDELLQGW